MTDEGSGGQTASGAGWRHVPRQIGAVALYLVLPVTGLWLVRSDWILMGLAVAFLNLLLLLATLLIFSTFPMPARPGTLRRNDFAALTWLPHVAVTRLTEGRLQGRARSQLVGRSVLAVVLLLGGNGAVGVAILVRVGLAHLSGWVACALILGAAFFSIAFVGRELQAAGGRLDKGTDIG